MESPPAGIPFPEDSQALGKLSVNQDLPGSAKDYAMCGQAR